MLSYTERRNLWGSLANNTETTALALADTLMNNSEKMLLSSRPWPFLEVQYTLSTDSTNQFVALPMYTDRVMSCYVTIGTNRYAPRECQSREMWDTLNQSTFTSDIPEYFFVYNGKLGLFPAPATSSNVITVNAKTLQKDLTLADYTTGGVLTATNGSTSITGTGTTWATSMAGRFIRITESDTTNKGDGHWYEIASVASATTLTLVRAYGGTSISAGNAAYTIAQVSRLPEQYHMIPIYDALGIYFTSVDSETDRADRYKSDAKELKAQLTADYGSKTQNLVIDPGFDNEELY